MPIPRRARGIPRGNTRWESNRCWWADTRMRQCLKDVFLACLVCFISEMMISRTDKGKQSLTRENNHWLNYQPTRPYCIWLFSVYCSYESDPLLDALGCFLMLLKALGNMLQPDKHFPWATRLGGPSIFLFIDYFRLDKFLVNPHNHFLFLPFLSFLILFEVTSDTLVNIDNTAEQQRRAFPEWKEYTRDPIDGCPLPCNEHAVV